MGILWQFIIGGIVAAVIAGAAYKAWNGFKESIAAPYVQAQREADQVHVNKANADTASAKLEAGNARQDTAACEATSKRQTDAVAKLTLIAQANASAAREAKARADKQATEAAPRIADLQAKAAAAPRLMACEEELTKAKDVLRNTLRSSRGIPAK